VTPNTDTNAYAFVFRTLTGDTLLPLSQFQGKVLLIVNTASYCGLTAQYTGLQALYERYKDQGLVIIGVPSNDFGNQEPGTNQEIADFCHQHYGITFLMASKEVVSGKHAHPFYQWAARRLGLGTTPQWNFHKYLVNRNGALVDYFHATTSPDSDRIRRAIEAALAEHP
jgi:glutathione peroxidase